MVAMSTPTGQKPEQQRKDISTYLGVDVVASGVGFSSDLAEAAARRREAKEPKAPATTSPKVL